MLVRVKLGDIDVDKAYLGILKGRLGGRRKVRVARPDADDQVCIQSHLVGAGCTAHTQSSEIQRMIVGQGAFPGLRFSHRDVRTIDKGAQRIRCLRVLHASACDDERPLGRLDPFSRPKQQATIGPVAWNDPHTGLKELLWIIIGKGLHVLRQGERHGASIRRAGEHAHGLWKGGDQLLGAIYPVPVATDGPEGVVHADILRMLPLQLLQHRRLETLSEDITGEQQHRNAVDGGCGGASDHVRGARPDRTCAGKGL